MDRIWETWSWASNFVAKRRDYMSENEFDELVRDTFKTKRGRPKKKAKETPVTHVSPLPLSTDMADPTIR